MYKYLQDEPSLAYTRLADQIDFTIVPPICLRRYQVWCGVVCNCVIKNAG